MDFDQLVIEIKDIKTSIAELSRSFPDDTSPLLSPVQTRGELVKFTKKYIDNRALRQKMIHPDIFPNPSWDIMVELFYARLIGKTEYVSSIATAGGTSPTTGLRHIAALERMGFLIREAHVRDKRRVNLQISDAAFNRLRDFFLLAARR